MEVNPKNFAINLLTSLPFCCIILLHRARMVADSDKGVGLARGDQKPSVDDGDRFLGAAC